MAETLTPKQKSALARALEDKQLLPLLIQNVKGLHWFDAFAENNLFSPANNPPPLEVEKNSFRILSWDIVEYLVAASELLKDGKHNDYAEKFLDIMRNATQYAKKKKYSNFRTWWQFAKILVNIPIELIKEKDLQMVEYWLADEFSNAGIISNEIARWLLQMLNTSNVASNKLALLLYSKTIALKTSRTKENRQEVSFKFCSDSMMEFIKKTAFKAGETIGFETAELFSLALEKALQLDKSDSYSYVWRPAIENHSQNMRYPKPKNALLVGLRESLFGLFKHDRDDFEVFLNMLVKSKFQIQKRLAIYFFGEFFDRLSPKTRIKPLQKMFFAFQFKHELWHYLNKNFHKLSVRQKYKVFSHIEQIEVLNDTKNIELKSTAFRQLEWLAAIRNDNQANEFYEKKLKIAGNEPDHPDFSSYFSHGWASNSSEISLEKMVGLSPDELVDKLNSYQEVKTRFDGPTLAGLANEFGAMIQADPKASLKKLDKFKRLKPIFLSELLNAFKELYSNNKKLDLDWINTGKKLVYFCSSIVNTKAFWKSDQTDGSMNGRFVSSISDMLNPFFENSANEIGKSLIEPAKELLLLILKNQSGADYSEECDAMSLAINNPRGRCLRSLLKIAMYAKIRDPKGSVWEGFKPIFDLEIKQTGQKSCDFTTIFTAYMQEFLVLSQDWVIQNLNIVFDRNDYLRWLCAMKGYSYCSLAYQPVYEFLKEHGAFLMALDDQHIDSSAKESIVHKVASAYLKGLEVIEEKNSLITILVLRKKQEEMLNLMWLISQYEDKKEILKGKVFTLWSAISNHLDLTKNEDKIIASQLCLWIKFFDNIEKDVLALILSGVSYAEENFNSYQILEQIAKISENQPDEAAQIWLKMLENSYAPYPEEAILQTLRNLCATGYEGERKANAIVSRYIAKGHTQAQGWLKSARNTT